MFKNTPRKSGRTRVQTVIQGKSKTQTSHEVGANINNIVKRYTKTGKYTTGFGENSQVPTFGHWESGENYHQVQCRIAHVKSEFAQLPAQVRSKYKNRPEVCIDFLASLKPNELTEEMNQNLLEAVNDSLLEVETYKTFAKKFEDAKRIEALSSTPPTVGVEPTPLDVTVPTDT